MSSSIIIGGMTPKEAAESFIEKGRIIDLEKDKLIAEADSQFAFRYIELCGKDGVIDMGDLTREWLAPCGTLIDPMALEVKDISMAIGKHEGRGDDVIVFRVRYISGSEDSRGKITCTEKIREKEFNVKYISSKLASYLLSRYYKAIYYEKYSICSLEDYFRYLDDVSHIQADVYLFLSIFYRDHARRM